MNGEVYEREIGEMRADVLANETGVLSPCFFLQQVFFK